VSDVERRSWNCEVARRSIHRRLDGESLGAGEQRELDRHLESCADCRESDEDLRAVQDGLRAIPLQTMPDEALQQVLDRTVRAERKRRLHRWGLDWRMAAAAVVTVGVIGIWFAFYPHVPQSAEPTEAELAQAAEDARMVFSLTARALRKAERTATREVLAGEVSGALRRVPIRWPSPEAPPGGGRPLL
jgi:anti-sigma factor RsiW